MLTTVHPTLNDHVFVIRLACGIYYELKLKGLISVAFFYKFMSKLKLNNSCIE